MKDSHFTTRIFRQFLERFSGNSKKSVFNPHDIDELVDRLNALSNITITPGTKNKAHLGAQGMILEINIPSTSAAVPLVIEQYDPAKGYAAKSIVFFTPDGDYASTFYALQDVPAGVSPDTGAPYWASFPNSPAGLWA